MNSLTYYLEFARSRNFTGKLEKTRSVIKNTLGRFKNPYVSYSTGKDSLTTLFLCMEVKSDISVMFHDSGVELPESYAIIKLISKKIKIEVIKSDLQVLSIYKDKSAFYKGGYDNFAFTDAMMKPINKYADEHKKDLAIIGLRKQESKRRKILLSTMGSEFYCKKNHINQFYPISDWTTRDVFAYIYSHNLLEYLHPAYQKNNFCDIEKIRVSWYCDPTMISRGSVIWLKYYYRELYNKLSLRFPEIRGYV